MDKISDITNIHLRYYADAAERLGISYKIIHPRFIVEFEKDNLEWRIFKSSVPINSVVANKTSKSKLITSKILRDKRLPAPRMAYFSNFVDAKRYFILAKKDRKVVVKPDDAMGGEGVTINPSTDTEFENAYNEAIEYSDYVLVEDFLEGVNYRVMVLDNRVIAVSERIPAFVVGDGKSMLEELIENENFKRKSGVLSEITIDNELERYISNQNLKMGSVISDGEEVTLRENCNMCTGGVTIDRTDDIHPDNEKICVEASKAVGLKLCAVDIITNDISRSLKDVGGGINELNSSPDLRLHYHPYKGAVRDVAKDIQRYIYEYIYNLS